MGRDKKHDHKQPDKRASNGGMATMFRPVYQLHVSGV